MELISRTINNRQTYVRPHATVLQACETAGVDIPRFCYHEKLSVSGNCRRCLVEIQKSPKPVVSCARPVTKGRVVFTDSPLVRKARESILEFLLVNHPLDCPICDQGGECDLQDEALIYGSDRGRIFEYKRSVEDKHFGPIVKTIRTRCIHCTRCVRFSTEVAGNEVLGAFGRGEEREIGTYVHTFLKTELSGNLVDLCPVGALTSKPYAFQSRNWELQCVDTIDLFDALASDIVIHTRLRTTTANIDTQVRFTPKEEIRRILPRTNGRYAENWISDRTRYAFDGLKNARITIPAVFPSTTGRCYRLRDGSGSVEFESTIERRCKIWVNMRASCSNWIKAWDCAYFPFVLGSQVNLQSVYIVANLLSMLGRNTLYQEYAPAQLRVDLPFFYSLNLSVQHFSKTDLSGLFLVGTNLRYEASVFNTRLRREQSTRGLNYLTVGTFHSLRYAHSHQGNSLRTLIASLENRLGYVTSHYLQNSPVGILLGVNSLRNNSASFLQKLVSALGKFYFVKTGQKERLGFVHSSVGSLAFAHLGFTICKGDKVKGITPTHSLAHSVYSVRQPAYSDSFYNWATRFNKRKSEEAIRIKDLIVFDTHFIPTSYFNTTRVYPITSFYEDDGHVLSLEGRRLKHVKAITAPAKARSFELMLTSIFSIHGEKFFWRWYEGLKDFYNETPYLNLSESAITSFVFNPFAYNISGQGNSTNYAKLVRFAQPVRNFYLQEPIATFSPTRAECSLFLGQETNFPTDM